MDANDCVSTAGRVGNGCDTLISSVVSFTALTLLMRATWLLNGDWRRRSMEKAAAAALNGVPSWKLTPDRNVNTQVVLSTARQLSASMPRGTKWASYVTNRSRILSVAW